MIPETASSINSHRKLFIGAILLTAVLIGISIVSMFIVPECMWIGTARTWVDQNQNGIWEDNEGPLTGVSLVLIYDDIEIATLSDQSGEATLALRIGCGVKFGNIELHAESPPGFEPTTPPTIKTSFFGNKRSFDFGFISNQ